MTSFAVAAKERVRAMDKETLRAYLPMKQELAQIRELIREVEEGRYNPNAPNKPRPVKALEYLDEDGDIVAVYQRKAKELRDRLLEIETAINTLPPKERTVIRWHYLKGLTWRQVAERENYSERQCKRLGKRALARLAGL